MSLPILRFCQGPGSRLLSLSRLIRSLSSSGSNTELVEAQMGESEMVMSPPLSLQGQTDFVHIMQSLILMSLSLISAPCVSTAASLMVEERCPPRFDRAQSPLCVHLDHTDTHVQWSDPSTTLTLTHQQDYVFCFFFPQIFCHVNTLLSVTLTDQPTNIQTDTGKTQVNWRW